MSILEEMRDKLSHIESELEVIKVKVTMLEKVVYGAVGIVLVAVITAGLALVIHQ